MVQKNKIFTKAHVTQQLKKARGKENKQGGNTKGKRRRKETSDAASLCPLKTRLLLVIINA